MDGQLAGFIWGEVVDNKDPLGVGRVTVRIEGLEEPNRAVMDAVPAGWPGAGGTTRGAMYPVPIGAQVALIFEHGDLDSTPLYLTGPYGAPDGAPIAPAVIREEFLKENGKDPTEITVIWEDEYFRFYVVGTGTTDRRIVMVEKATQSHIILNATDGDSGKSVTLSLAANSSISIKSNGVINIDGLQVYIQGRLIARRPGLTSI